MDEKSQETLKAILELDKDTLSRDQMEFVMARRSYLNDEGKKRFEKEIKLHEKGELFQEEEKEGLEGMSMKALAAKAKALGIKKIKDMDRRALIKEIIAIEGEEE